MLSNTLDSSPASKKICEKQTNGKFRIFLPDLGAALAVNNAGIGLAAGITGLSPVLAAVCNFILTLLALRLGQVLGRRLTRWSALALPLSGALLVALGLWQLVRIT